MVQTLGKPAANRPCEGSSGLFGRANLLNKFKLIWVVQSPPQKYFCFSEMQIKLYDSPSRPT
jgi:hypothetical protein